MLSLAKVEALLEEAERSGEPGRLVEIVRELARRLPRPVMPPAAERLLLERVDMRPSEMDAEPTARLSPEQGEAARSSIGLCSLR